MIHSIAPRRRARRATVLVAAALNGLAAASPAMLFAQTQDETDQAPAMLDMEAVEIEALRVPQSKGSVPNTVTIIDQEALDTQQAVTDDLSAILANTVPNFSPGREKLTSAGESLRGRSPLYLIDGVPQSNPLRDGSRDAHTIDPDLLERIEVVNGSSAIQGLGAAGGIINLQTRDLAQSERWNHFGRFRVNAADDFDSDGFGYKGVLMTGRQFGQTDLTLGATYQVRELYFDGDDNPVGVDPTQGDLADSKSRDLFIKTGYRISPAQRVQLMVNDYRLRGNGDYNVVPGNRAAEEPATSERGDPGGDPATNDVTTVSLDYRHDDLARGRFRAQAFYQDFAALYGGGTFATFQDPTIAPDGTLYDQSENQSEKRGLKLSYSYAELFVPDLTATIGVDYLEDETTQVLAQTGREWVPRTTFENIAPFLQLNQLLLEGRMLISGGVRYERAELQADDFTTIAGAGGVSVEGGNPDFDEVLPNVGVVFDLTDELSLYASYSEGFTMPDVGRVLRGVSTPGQSVDSLLNLEPVISDNEEIGLDYRSLNWRVHAAYFWSESDLGARLENVGGIFQVRRERTEIDGFELSAQRDLSSRTQVGLLYSYINGEYDSDNDGSVDTDLDGNNINPDRLNLYVQWQAMDFLPVDGRLQVSRLFPRDFGGTAAVPGYDFDGYTLVDLSLAKRTEDGTYRLGLENLLDEQYITYFSQAASTLDERYFAGRGRTIIASFETGF
ncbi:MAG: TonB-dependent receptor [Salinisphaeraceae bacterium]|nr:TonB-dependent receptor [Salinisphaeraceae bacterium]